MKRSRLRNLLFSYGQRFPEEKETVHSVISFLNNDENCFERNNWKGHFTGSAWVLDRRKSAVLMTHHRQLDRWLQLGGHAEGNVDLLEVALTEAREESGLKNFNVLSREIFDLDIHPIQKHGESPAHFHYDIRFILETRHGPEEIVISDESHDVAWIPLDEILALNPEPAMKRMLEKTKNRRWQKSEGKK